MGKGDREDLNCLYFKGAVTEFFVAAPLLFNEIVHTFDYGLKLWSIALAYQRLELILIKMLKNELC